MSLKSVLTKLVNNFRKSKGRDPNYAIVQGKKYSKPEYKKIINTKPTVIVKTYNSDKDPFLKSLANAIGGRFNTLTEAYELIRKNESYANYQLDKKAQDQAVESLAKNTGLNCVDFSQIMAAVCDKLNKVANKGYSYRYVRTYCPKSKTGHVYLEVKGAELGKVLVPVDAAAGASKGSKYKIGAAWCMDYSNKIYNQEYLKLDDGR